MTNFSKKKLSREVQNHKSQMDLPLLHSHKNDNHNTFNNDDYDDIDVEVKNHKWV